MPTAKVSHDYRERHNCVRAGFVRQGTTLSAWCDANGVKRQNATRALLGTWNGPKAQCLVERLKAAAGVQDT